MSVYYLLGQANSGKSTFLCKKALEFAENEKKTVIMIVPEQFALKTETDLVKMSSGHGIMNIEVLSFTRLAYRIMEEANDKAYPILDDMGKTMLIKTILRENCEQLHVYRKKDNSISFVDEIKSCISELMSYMITYDMLMPEEEDNSLLSYKRRDIALIYREFLKKIEGVYTTAESLDELCFRHINTSDILKNSIIILDGFTGFTPVQYAFLEHIFGVCSDVYVSLCADKSLKHGDFVSAEDYGNYKGIFSMSAEVLSKLTKITNDNGLYARIIDFDEYCTNVNSIKALSSNIFRTVYSKQKECEGIYINSFSGIREESYHAAAMISDLLRNNNYHFRDVAIICGDIDSYGIYLKAALTDYNINYYIDETRCVDKNILISFIHNAIKVIDSDYSREAVVNFIKSPLAGFDFKTVCEFDNYLSSYNYRGRKKYARPFTSTLRIKGTIDIDKINELRASLVEKISMLPAKLDKLSIKEFIKSLYEFLESFNVEEKLKNIVTDFEGVRLYDKEAMATEYDKVYTEVIKVLERIAELNDGTPVSYKEFDDLFMMGIKKLKLGMIPESTDVVTIGDVKRTRLKDIKALFFLGVNEGVIPEVGRNGIIFSSDDKEILKKNGVELSPVIKTDPYREEFYLYLALSKPSDKLYLSYINVDNEGNELRPSYILGQIKNIFPELKINEMHDTLSEKIGFDNGFSYFVGHDNNRDELYYKLKAYYEDIGGYKNSDIDKMKLMICEPVTALSDKIALKLYGEILKGSVTKLEEYAACHYKFFIRYGLGLIENYEAEPGSIDFGNIFHKALSSFGKYLSDKKDEYDSLSEEEVVENGISCISRAVNEYQDGLYFEDERLEFFAERMETVMEITSKAIFRQLKSGDYKPELFEKNISLSGVNYDLSGVIDRIDVLRNDECSRIKIVDYKTGSQDFSYAALLEGISLQLPVYMNAAMELFDNPISANMFYQHVDNPVLEKKEDVAVDEKLKALKPVGLGVFSDINIGGLDRGAFTDGIRTAGYDSPVIKYGTKKDGDIDRKKTNMTRWIDDASMAVVTGHALKKVSEFSKDILSGNISVNPSDNKVCKSCDYCNYRGICGFDNKLSKFEYRNFITDEIEAYNELMETEKEEG